MNKIKMGLLVSISVMASALGGCAATDEAAEEEVVDESEDELIVGNMLQNGNFQRGLKHWQVRAGKERGEAVINSALPCYELDPTCPQFLALTGGTREKSTASQTVSARAGVAYLLRFKAATDTPRSDPEQRVFVEFLDRSGTEIGQKSARVEVDPRAWTCSECIPAATAWKKNSLAFTTPPRTASIRVKFVGKADPPMDQCYNYSGTPKCWAVSGKYDNVSLVKS